MKLTRIQSGISGFLIIICLNTGLVSAQSGFLAGTAQSGIEPDESLISLHLGGYGAPRDGRFTLQWINHGTTPDAQSMAGLKDKLYILSGSNLLYCTPAMPKPVWSIACKADNIIAVSGYEDKLYALKNNGDLFEGKSPTKIKWKKIGTADITAKFLSVSSGKLWITDGNGTLMSADILKKSFKWENGAMVNNIISFSSDKGKLYALTKDGILYKSEASEGASKWLKIAYRNNETIKEDIRLIAFLEGRIYGISKDNFLYLGEHRSEGNLTARAIAIKEGKQTIVIVNVDVCGLTADFTGLLKKEILQKNQLPASAVFINSSHTHFAPVSQNWLTWQEANQRPDSIYLYSIVRNGILTAVDKALINLAPAELYFGRGTSDIGYNRSLKDHPELYDSDVDVLKIAYSDRKPESYLFMASCHPVFSTAGKLHYTISANYPGVARKLLEERTGTTNSLFLQGTAGDINPKDNGEYITGEKLANEVIAILNKPMTKIEGSISSFLDTINIPITPWSKEEICAFREQNAGKAGDVYAEKNVKWCDLMIYYYNNGIMPESLPEYVHTINIGNWKLVGFSRETTTGYSLGVKNLWPGKLISVAGYTNDVSSYLPTHMHLEAKNYEGLDSFFWYGMANVFPLNADEIILGRIKQLAH
jgi:hypothetical protein